jgi:hypothetical protein
VILAGLAGLAGIAAIVAGVHLSTREPGRTLSTDTTLIPDADLPVDQSVKEDDTEPTFDLGALVPPSTGTPRATTSTTAPTLATTTTVPRGFALVHVNNATAIPVSVWLTDADQHATVLPAGNHVDWVVKTKASGTDSGGARVDGTNCGGTWSGVDNVVGGREYHLEILPSVGFCALGQPMPLVVLTDYTLGASKIVAGAVPDESHALIYVVNKYDAATKLTVDDGDTIEWTMDPTIWGAPQRLTTSTDNRDAVKVTRLDQDCGYGDTDDYFAPAHTYRIEVVKSASYCGGVRAPALVIYDLTTLTSRRVG